MTFTPFPHQQLAIDHLLRNEEAGLFAGMGLGKTASTLAALDHLISNGDCRGALVIAPLRVSVFTWPDEVATWDNFRWMRAVSLRTEEGIEAWHRGEACIYTINYESLFIPKYGVRVVKDRYGKIELDELGRPKKEKYVASDTGILAKLFDGVRSSNLPVDTVVWDEISKASNHQSKRIKEFEKHRDKFHRHWGLTGTPASNGYINLFNQIKLLDGGKRFGKYITHFRQQYFEPVNPHAPQVQWKWQVRAGCAGLIEEKIRDLVLTLRSEDYLDIPPVQKVDVPVALPGKAMTIYKKLEKEMLVRLKDSKVKAVNKGVLVGKLQQILGGAVYANSADPADILASEEGERVVTEIHDAKIKALRKLWEQEGRKPMLVGTQFIHERERICAAIPEAVEFSSDKLDDWNAGKIPLLVAHPASMGHGLNMQRGGNRLVWFTPTYDLEQYDQMNARLARTGQKEETKIFHLLASGTADDAVMAALESKDKTQSGLMKTLTNIQRLRKIR